MTSVDRIISLVPSLTETVFELNRGEALVGVTRYCVEPAEGIARIPTVGGTKNPDLEQIAQLSPGLVLVNTEENRRVDIDWLRQRFEVFESRPTTIDQAAEVLRQLATRLDAWDDSESLILEIEAQLMRIDVESLARERIRVFYPIWQKPWMSINSDTYIHSVLQRIGAENVCADYQERYPVVREESLQALQPDLVLLPSEPYSFGLSQQAEVLQSGLFPGKPVLLADGRDFSWHGARTGRALGRLHDFMIQQRPWVDSAK